jgi:hypothetical protein
MPLLGYTIGSTNKLRFITNLSSFKTFIFCSIVAVIHFISDISFSYDLIDNLIFSLLLITFGYSGSKINANESALKNKYIKMFKLSLIVFYISIPIVLGGIFYTVVTNNWIGTTVKINDNDRYRIKHVCKNGNFNFSGIHYATVYKTFILFEVPISRFNLGNYGLYGFNEYTIINDKMIQTNKFEYDDKSNSLILLEYNSGKYLKTKEFKHKSP